MTVPAHLIVKITVSLEWDERREQTTAFQPANSHSALILYSVSPTPDEAGLPAPVATALASGLTSFGLVVGRWLDEDKAPPLNGILLKPSRRSLFKLIWEQLSETWPVPVLSTTDPGTVVEMLNIGWDVQQQAFIVSDRVKTSSAAMTRAAHDLARRSSWTDFSFPSPFQALIAPGVDGDAILVAAASHNELQRLLSTLNAAFQAAGFTVNQAT